MESGKVGDKHNQLSSYALVQAFKVNKQICKCSCFMNQQNYDSDTTKCILSSELKQRMY